MSDTLNYGRKSDAKVSRLARFSCFAPMLVVPLCFLGGSIATSFERPEMTPATRESLELWGALPPFVLSGVLGLVAVLRLSHQKRGMGWAVAGMILSAAMFLGVAFLIVSSHAWVD
jgi:hypothetical protein